MEKDDFKMIQAQLLVIYKRLLTLEEKRMNVFRSTPDSVCLEQLKKEALKIMERF